MVLRLDCREELELSQSEIFSLGLNAGLPAPYEHNMTAVSIAEVVQYCLSSLCMMGQEGVS